MVISGIISEYGDYFINSGQGVKDMMEMLREKSETEALFPRIITTDTVVRRSSTSFSRVLQRFQKAFTPTGTPTFTPRKIELGRLKIDVSEYPDELVDTWQEFLADLDEADRRNWPFVKWWTSQLIKQAREDNEIHEIFKGVEGSITAGTATAAGASYNGIRKQIRDAVTATTWNSIATGAPETDPSLFVSQIEDWFYQIPELVRSELDAIPMNQTLAQRFRTGMRERYNMNYEQAKDKAVIIDTSVRIVGVRSHEGSNMWWATPKWNRAICLKNPENENGMGMESEDRKVKAWTDFHKGVGFFIPQYGYCNDQDLS